MKILFPELSTNIIAKQSAKSFPDIEFIPTESLDQAASLLKSGAADSMISGLDYSSRDVLLAYKDRIPLSSDFFSSCFICQKGDQILAIADGGVNKTPTKEQLYTIV